LVMAHGVLSWSIKRCIFSVKKTLVLPSARNP